MSTSFKLSASYIAGRNAALQKFATGLGDAMSPLVARMLASGAVGGVSGALGGAIGSEDGHRGRGALKGGLIGALSGAGVGAGSHYLSRGAPPLGGAGGAGPTWEHAPGGGYTQKSPGHAAWRPETNPPPVVSSTVSARLPWSREATGTDLETALPPKIAAAYAEGREAVLFKFGLTKEGAWRKQASVADVWHDLSPLARRMLAGGAIGGAAGAATGAAVSEDGHRGSGALKGGLIGAAGGATLGAGYNALRPIEPLAMPGLYDGHLGIRTRTVNQDYQSIHPADAPPFSPKWPDYSAADRTRVQSKVRDAVGRPIGILPQMSPVHSNGPDLSHLSVVGARPRYMGGGGEGAAGDIEGLLTALHQDTYNPVDDTLKPFVPKVPARFELGYHGPLEHGKPNLYDELPSSQENELRRLLRKQHYRYPW